MLDRRFAIAYVNRSLAWTMLGNDDEARKDVEMAAALGLDRDAVMTKIEELKAER